MDELVEKLPEEFNMMELHSRVEEKNLKVRTCL